MNTALEQMSKKYDARTPEDKKNAMKEIMQEIVLSGLARGGFFKKAAFYGGTALRIFHGLDRFSEDLDFSLLIPDKNFNLSGYFPMVEKEVTAYGLKVDISEKTKSIDSTIKSAFLKGNTKEQMLLFYADEQASKAIHQGETIKIKFEVDIDPPEGASFENRFQLLPAPYEIRLYDTSSLFAGKVHAVLCRAWGSRMKGRDLYDYVFFISRGAKINLPHLKARMIDSRALNEVDPFDINVLKQMLNDRFDAIDYEAARDDVRSFIRDKDSLNIWCPEFFKQITQRIEAAE